MYFCCLSLQNKYFCSALNFVDYGKVTISPFHRSFPYKMIPAFRTLVKRAAPSFTAPAVINKEFKDISLSDYKGKWVVLFFYPLDWTFVCPTEILEFSERSKEFKGI